MNTLAYGLLGLVARTPSSGYDLMLQLQPYWQAKHSQIYPLLAKLEQEGYMQFTRVHQTDRPDKKVYSITDKGEIALKMWLEEPTAEPVVRDELVLKAYCLQLTDEKAAHAMFRERIDHCREQAQMFEHIMKEMEQQTEGHPDHPDHPAFSDYILLSWGCRRMQEDMKWCEWVLELLQKRKKE
ncbi:PadR family transcriptional regulator [Brevibacillus choshinensis]|uniref:PadR family transcriptional regulator n=1 Tax=Brevibacillus choshinensis TaxID=54911 RepID=UPI002E1C7048|nr:PadR family transcriptional regulator [Brevibacillus choshinensis]MED4752839.1 PadR family transcriptional regulator [Brevibacillus choshinensis]MED4781584.1 PadR family transcriptional regulator [Brevibacillus choshinensis]